MSTDAIAGGITRASLDDAIAILPESGGVQLLGEHIFDTFLKPQPVPWWGEDPWVIVELEKLFNGELDFSALVLADQMDEWNEPEAAIALRRVADKTLLATTFREVMRYAMAGDLVLTGSSSLIEARQQIATRILEDGFGWWYIRRTAVNAVNDFTRTKMREDGFYRRIMPPMPITGPDLDRAVPTDAPATIRDTP